MQHAETRLLSYMGTKEWTEEELANHFGISMDSVKTLLRSLRKRRKVLNSPLSVDGGTLQTWRVK